MKKKKKEKERARPLNSLDNKNSFSFNISTFYPYRKFRRALLQSLQNTLLILVMKRLFYFSCSKEHVKSLAQLPGAWKKVEGNRAPCKWRLFNKSPRGFYAF